MQEVVCAQSDISGLFECFSWVSSILKKCLRTSTKRMLWPNVRQRKKTGLLFERSFFTAPIKMALNLCVPALYSSSVPRLFLPVLNWPFDIKSCLGLWALSFIFSNHLAHSQFQSSPSWKWHKLLFGLPHRSVPLLLFSSGDYRANLSRINARGEGIPFVRWEQEMNWGQCRRNASDISITMSSSF